MHIVKILTGSAGVLLVLTLAACSPLYGGPTGYTKANPLWTTQYGYREKQIDDDEFSVVVTGNPLTSKERVAAIALLRAARLTQEKGKTHFLVIRQKTETVEAEELISLPLGGLLVWVPVGSRATKEPTAILLIHLLSVQSSYSSDALNAADVIERLAKHLEGAPLPPDDFLQAKLLETGSAMGRSLVYENRPEGLFIWRFAMEVVGSAQASYACDFRFAWYMKRIGNEIWVDDPGIVAPGCPMDSQQLQAEIRRQQEDFKQRWLALVGPIPLKGPTPATHSAQILGEALARSLKQ